MSDWTAEYAEADGLNEQYRILRDQLATLRGRREAVEYFDEAAVAADIRTHSRGLEGALVVFVANDFGRPRAYRPDDVAQARQDEIREAVLEDKYDDSHGDLDAIRRDLLESHPGIHKAIVAEITPERVRYHLPEGSTEPTNFITVREMIGLIDYTTNSFQSDGLSLTY